MKDREIYSRRYQEGPDETGFLLLSLMAHSVQSVWDSGFSLDRVARDSPGGSGYLDGEQALEMSCYAESFDRVIRHLNYTLKMSKEELRAEMKHASFNIKQVPATSELLQALRLSYPASVAEFYSRFREICKARNKYFGFHFFRQLAEAHVESGMVAKQEYSHTVKEKQRVYINARYDMTPESWIYLGMEALRPIQPKRSR